MKDDEHIAKVIERSDKKMKLEEVSICFHLTSGEYTS